MSGGRAELKDIYFHEPWPEPMSFVLGQVSVPSQCLSCSYKSSMQLSNIVPTSVLLIPNASLNGFFRLLNAPLDSFTDSKNVIS